MNKVDPIHQRPAEMKQALEFTASKTGFVPHFLEKDYWCSIILKQLHHDGTELVLKGGTLLSKAFTSFNRLSEDLDFTLPAFQNTSRKTRSARAKKVASQLNRLIENLQLSWEEEWTGHNNSKQYAGRIRYPSVLRERESILIEVGQREPIADKIVDTPLKTLLQDPLHQEPVFLPFPARSLSLMEAYAEKVRATLTREKPAIRDLYDIWIASKMDLLPIGDSNWLNLIHAKCEDFDLTEALSVSRETQFQAGIETELIPMLRSEAAENFQYESALAFAERLLSQLLNYSPQT